MSTHLAFVIPTVVVFPVLTLVSEHLFGLWSVCLCTMRGWGWDPGTSGECTYVLCTACTRKPEWSSYLILLVLFALGYIAADQTWCFPLSNVWGFGVFRTLDFLLRGTRLKAISFYNAYKSTLEGCL